MYLQTLKRVGVGAGLLALMMVNVLSNSIGFEHGHVNNYKGVSNNVANRDLFVRQEVMECPPIGPIQYIANDQTTAFGTINYDPSNVVSIPCTEGTFKVSFDLDGSSDVQFIISSLPNAASTDTIVGYVNLASNGLYYIGHEIDFSIAAVQSAMLTS
ncbi:hypothetical protein AYI68_g4981, partial [Smittium mucronatum]